jgi:hypothetical protein
VVPGEHSNREPTERAGPLTKDAEFWHTLSSVSAGTGNRCEGRKQWGELVSKDESAVRQAVPDGRELLQMLE